MKKNMYRIIGAVLTATLVSTMVVGCGSNINSSDKDTSNESVSKESASNESASNASEIEISEQTFTFTTTFSEKEYAGQIIKELSTQLEELSGGKITLDVYYGGVMAGTGEELSFVGDGGVDMALIGQSEYTNVLSLLNFPSEILTGYADSVALLDDIAFNNENTKDAVQAEIQSNNVIMFGCMPGGSNSFITTKEYTTLEEMKGIKLGIGMNQTAMEKLGFSVVTMMPWDYYDSLSRGIADAGYMSTTGLVSMSIQEVTPYFLQDGTYTAGNFVTMNLDKWNSLDDATQEIMKKAVANTQAYACELAETLDQEAAATIEAAGGKINTVNDTDAATIQKVFFETGCSDARTYAKAAGTSDAMEIILEEVAKVIGQEVPEQ